jgi:hypothetical protein
LTTLATILLRHHERSGAVDELEEAISNFTEALSLCPANHCLRPRLLALQAKLVECQSSSLPPVAFAAPTFFTTWSTVCDPLNTPSSARLLRMLYYIFICLHSPVGPYSTRLLP